jgi:hypothetical protein
MSYCFVKTISKIQKSCKFRSRSFVTFNQHLSTSPSPKDNVVAVIVGGQIADESNIRIRSIRKVVRSVEQSEEDTWGKFWKFESESCGLVVVHSAHNQKVMCLIPVQC